MSKLALAVERLEANDAQWAAFTQPGHCVVLAPPGSGKTSLLTTRLAAELANSRGPRGAACITMTNEAAGELRRRLERLGVGHRPNLFVGTVHSFALHRIVNLFGPLAGHSDVARRRLASGVERRRIFEEAAYEHGYERDEFSQVSTTVERARQRLDLSGSVALGGDRIAAVGLAIQEKLAANGLVDFLDLVRFAVEIVEESNWVRLALASAFPLVYVDEYQDLPPGLDRLVRQWALPADTDATLFAVGDPDQSIFAFSGAHPELLLSLADEPSVTTVRLLRNYRSGQFIIDSASTALGLNYSVAGERDGGVVRAHFAPGGELAQAQLASELVLELLEAGTAPEQIAVISAWGQDRDRVASALRDAGVPVFARGDGAWRATQVTALIEKTAAWISQGAESGTDLPELLSAYASVLRSETNSHRALAEVVTSVRESDGFSAGVLLVDRLLSGGLGRVLRSSNGEDRLEIESMRSWLAENLNFTVADLGALARSPGRVMATTIHSAKGLEFDAVVIAGADSAAIDGFSRAEADIAEARRKFYVAVTRARHEVHLVYTDVRTSAKGNAYPVAPSVLISRLLLTD